MAIDPVRPGSATTSLTVYGNSRTVTYRRDGADPGRGPSLVQGGGCGSVDGSLSCVELVAVGGPAAAGVLVGATADLVADVVCLDVVATPLPDLRRVAYGRAVGRTTLRAYHFKIVDLPNVPGPAIAGIPKPDTWGMTRFAGTGPCLVPANLVTPNGGDFLVAP